MSGNIIEAAEQERIAGAAAKDAIAAMIDRHTGARRGFETGEAG